MTGDVLTRRERLARDPTWALPVGTLVSNVGNGMYLLAVGMVLYRVSGSTASFTLLVVLEALAALATQAFASVGADRGHAQRLASLAEYARGGIVAVAGVVAWCGHHQALIVAGVLLSLLRPFYRTAVFALGPVIAQGQELARYNARTSSFMQVGQVVGAGLAGALLVVSPYVPIFVNAASYVVSGALLAGCRIPGDQRRVGGLRGLRTLLDPRSAWLDWWTALRAFVVRRRTLLLGVLCSVDAVVIAFVNLVYAPLLVDAGLGAWWLSAWDAAFAVGAVAGANLFGAVRWFHRGTVSVVLALLLQAAMLALIGRTGPVEMVAVMLVLGLGSAVSVSAFTYFLQTSADVGLAGRVSGVRQLFIATATTLVVPQLSRGVQLGVEVGSARAAAVAAGVALLVVVAVPSMVASSWRRAS